MTVSPEPYIITFKLMRMAKNNNDRVSLETWSEEETYLDNKALRSVNRKSTVYRKYRDKDHHAVKRATRSAAKEIKKSQT